MLAVAAGLQNTVAVRVIGLEGGCKSTVGFRAYCGGLGVRFGESASVGLPVAA